MSVEQDDELMAVLMGEPSRAEGGDAAERHLAAERDLAVVREQLRWIGDGLVRKAAAGQRPEPAPAPRKWLRRGLFALAASVAVALLGTGTAYLVATNGGGQEGGSEALLTSEGLVACSRDIAEGTVERVEPLGGDDRFRIVLDVNRSYKPEDGQRKLTFTDRGPGVPRYYRTGALMLVLVSTLPGEGPQTFRAGDAPYPDGRSGPARDALETGRLLVEQALPGAQGLACPGGV